VARTASRTRWFETISEPAGVGRLSWRAAQPASSVRPRVSAMVRAMVSTSATR